MKGWKEKAQEDLSRADIAHLAGNEGLARVCARRAAGWAAGALLEKENYSNLRKTAFENILELSNYKKENKRIVELCGHLTASLKKDALKEITHLPENVDLLADARELIKILFPQFSESS